MFATSVTIRLDSFFLRKGRRNRTLIIIIGLSTLMSRTRFKHEQTLNSSENIIAFN